MIRLIFKIFAIILISNYNAITSCGTLWAQSITIGNQVWMVSNLNVGTFQNGDSIKEAKTEKDWKAARKNKQPAWCWYNNDSSYGKKFGRQYNWYSVVDSRGLCPLGWHVPSKHDWLLLVRNLGLESDTFGLESSSDVGGKLKEVGIIEAGTGLWNHPNTGATNSSGFSGLPGGTSSSNGPYGIIGEVGYWWSTTERASASAWYFGLFYTTEKAFWNTAWKPNGFSVRCLKD